MYSCGHISGRHELILTKFGLWRFFIMIYRYIVFKTLKCKKSFFVTSSLRYSFLTMANLKLKPSLFTPGLHQQPFTGCAIKNLRINTIHRAFARTLNFQAATNSLCNSPGTEFFLANQDFKMLSPNGQLKSVK